MSRTEARAYYDKKAGDPDAGYITPADAQSAVDVTYRDMEAGDQAAVAAAVAAALPDRTSADEGDVLQLFGPSKTPQWSDNLVSALNRIDSNDTRLNAIEPKLPTASTDNTLPRFDGTAGKLQGSPITVADDGKISGGYMAGSGTGTGSPEGSRPGNRGDVWVQTDHPTAVGGILVWRKRTGTGTTGWVVVEGETPWYDISSLLVNGWVTSPGSTLQVRRVADRVIYLASNSGINGAAKTSNTFTSYPLGTPTNVGNWGPLGMASGGLTVSNDYYGGPSCAATGAVVFNIAFSTTSPWPAFAPV